MTSDPGAGDAPTTRKFPKWSFSACGGGALCVLLVVATLVIVHLATPDTSERESDTLTKTGATADDATSTNVHPTRTGGGTTGDGDGSREHPLPAGTTVSVQISGGGSLDITLGEPNLNADDEIARQNDRRGRPSEGSKYIIVPVTATYHGDESALPWYDAIVEYKSPNGPTFEDSYANLDTGVLDVDDLHDGETVKYEMAIMVPDDHVEDGRMLIRALGEERSDAKYVYLT